MKSSHPIDATLLQPSLSGDTGQLKPIYSATTMALTAFFGGPFAVVSIAALNSERLQRIAKDGVWPIVAVIASAALIPLLYRDSSFAGAAVARSVEPRILIRAFSLALFAALYALHRRAHRSMRFTELKAPSPWRTAIGCGILGILLQVAVMRWAQP